MSDVLVRRVSTELLRHRWLILGVIGVLLVLMAVPDIREMVLAFLNGAFGGRRNFNFYTTLGRSSLIIGMALSVLIAFRAGIINIGGEGQLVLGGLTAALVGIYLPGPPLVVMGMALLAAMIVAGLWAMLAGLLERKAGIPLLVGSLLLNYPAALFASYLVSHPLRDIYSGDPQTHRIATALRLPRVSGTILDYGFFLVIVVALVVIFVERHSVPGYRVRLQGYSYPFARASGFPVGRLYYQILASSGMVAGLVGFIAVFGLSYRYIDGMLVIPLYAWTGIAAVLMAGMLPWATPLAGLFFAVLATGSAGLERSLQVPREFSQVVQGVLILYLAGVSGGLLSSRERGDEGM